MTQNLNISDSRLGSRFWTVTDSKVPEDQQGLAPLVANDPTLKKLKHNSTLTSFANSGGDPMAQSAINRAELFAASHTLNAEAVEAENQRRTTNLQRLVGDDAAVDALVDEVAEIYASTDDALEADDVRESCRTALNKLVVTSEFDKRANIHVANDPQGTARRLGPAGLAALKNAMVGLASMLKEGRISESAVLILAEGKYYDAANRADLLRLVADSAQRVKDLFVGEDRFDALIKQCEDGLRALGDDVSQERKNQIEGLISQLKNQKRIAVEARKEAVAMIKTDYKLTDPTGSVKSDKKFQKKQIDEIRDSLRAFRYGLDCATGKDMGKMERMRRFFDQLRSSHKSENLTTTDQFNNLRRLDNDFNACLTEIRTRLFGAQQAPQEPQPEKDVFEKVSTDVSRTDIVSVDDAANAATTLSHLTNDRIRYHYSGAEKREKAYLDDINEQLGDIAKSGGSRTVTLKAGVDALLGLDFKGLALNVKAGVSLAVAAKVSVSTEDGSVSVTYSIAGEGKGSATAKFGVDPDSDTPKAGIGAKVEASVSGSVTRSVTKTYANLEEFAQTISRLNMVMMPRPREVFYATSKAAIKGVGHSFVLGATALGFRISRSKMDQAAYSAVLRNRNVFGNMSGVFLQKRNIAVLSERKAVSIKGALGAKAQGGAYFSTGENSVDSNLEFNGSLGVEYTRELSAKGKLYQSFAVSMMQCSAEYLKSSFDFEAAALEIGKWRGDILDIVKNGADNATAIKENISKLSEMLTELEESAVGGGKKDGAFWDDFAAKARVIAIATALLTKRAEALDDGDADAADAKKAARAAGEYIIPRLANPVVKVPQKVFKEKFFNIFNITTPRTSRLTGYFSVGYDLLGNFFEEKMDDFGVGSDDAKENPVRGVGKTAAEGLVDIGKETAALASKIEVRVTRESKVSKHNDARPWLNDHKTTVDLRVTASMPIRIIFDMAARYYLKTRGNPDSDESQKFLGEFWDGLKDGFKMTAEDVIIQNTSPLLNMTLGDAAKKYPALGKLLGGVDFLTGKYNADYKFNDDTFKTLRFSFSGDGRFNGLTLADDYDTEAKLEFTPQEYLSINLSYSSKTSVNDWTIIPRPTVNTLLGRAAEYGAAGNPEGFANFLKRNQKGTLRMIQAGRTNAVPANDRYWQKDKEKMNATFVTCRNLLAEMAATPGRIGSQAREMQASFDALVDEVKNQPADIEPQAALNLAQRFFSTAAQIYTMKAMQGE